MNVAFVRNDPHVTTTAGWRLIFFHVACQLASPRGEHPTPLLASPRGEPCITMYEMNLLWTSAFFAPPHGVFSRALGLGRQGTRLNPGCKFRSRPGSMARALGVQSREIWEITTGRHSEHVEPCRPMQTHAQVQKMSHGLRMLFRVLLTPRTDCLATSCSCSSAPLSG